MRRLTAARQWIASTALLERPPGSASVGLNILFLGAILAAVALAFVNRAPTGGQLSASPSPTAGSVDVIGPTAAIAGSFDAASAAAVVYEMWEIVPIQITFFASVAVLLTDPRRVGGVRLGRPMASVRVLVAAIFLFGGHRMSRSWDDR